MKYFSYFPLMPHLGYEPGLLRLTSQHSIYWIMKISHNTTAKMDKGRRQPLIPRMVSTVVLVTKQRLLSEPSGKFFPKKKFSKIC